MEKNMQTPKKPMPPCKCDLCGGDGEGKELLQLANNVVVCIRCRQLRSSQVDWLIAVAGANIRKEQMHYHPNVKSDPLCICIACGQQIVEEDAWQSIIGYYHAIPQACKEMY